MKCLQVSVEIVQKDREPEKIMENFSQDILNKKI